MIQPNSETIRTPRPSTCSSLMTSAVPRPANSQGYVSEHLLGLAGSPGVALAARACIVHTHRSASSVPVTVSAIRRMHRPDLRRHPLRRTLRRCARRMKVIGKTPAGPCVRYGDSCPEHRPNGVAARSGQTATRQGPYPSNGTCLASKSS